MVLPKQLRRAAAITGLALSAAAQSSCKMDPSAPTAVDLSNVATDTVMRVNDDRTTIVAATGARVSYAVVSDTAPFVELRDSRGASVRFGSSGDGPGEFRFPSGVAWSSDTLVVWDPSSGRLTLFDREGGLLGVRSAHSARGKITPRMLRDGFGEAGRIAATPNGVVVAVYEGAVRQSFGLWSIALVRIRPDGTLDTIPVAFPPVDQLRELNENAQELVAVPLWASCGARGLATWDPVGGVLRRYTTAGTAGRSDSVGGQTVALTDDLIRINLRYQLDGLLQGKRPEPAVYDQMIESMLKDSHGPRPTYPRTAPAFVSMQCDDTGTVWLQRFSLADAGSGMGQSWTLVDPAGKVSGVRLPPNLRVLQVADGAVWGVRSGEDGQLFLLKLVLPTP